jgi:SecY interacting protein Syd
LQKYHTSYQEKLGQCPRHFPRGEDSACIQGEFALDSDEAAFWLPVRREQAADFENVETALELALRPELGEFYGHYFAAPMLFTSPWGDGELLQVWNQQDFVYLQQNIIGHLMMKKQLGQAPTWFVGLLDEGDRMLTVDNADGSVWIEVPGESPSEKLTDSLGSFISALTPRVAPPVKHEEMPMPALEHPGIFAGIGRMWRNLLGK